jgi:SanA protein
MMPVLRLGVKKRMSAGRRLTLAARNLALAAAGLAIVGGLAAWIIIVTIRHAAAERSYQRIEDAPARPIAIVFGAGVWPGGQLSNVLADRVETAVALYRAGKVRKLLMTGDNRFAWYNEPGAMGEYAEQRGVPAADIVYDYAGRRTYDSCYRARHIFGIESAILVTQAYHLPRALYTCRQMGIDAVGIAADRQAYQYIRRFRLRELPALLVAWFETNFLHPLPVLGDPIPIAYD